MSIASVERAGPAPRARPSLWSPATNPDCCATSSEFYGAAFPRCPRLRSRLSSRRRRRPLTVIVGRGIVPRAIVKVTARRRDKAVRAITEDAIRVAHPPPVVQVPGASASSSAGVSAKTAWEPALVGSLRNPHPGSDASERTPRSLVSIRACCRSRSACLRIRRHTPVRAASAAQCRR